MGTDEIRQVVDVGVEQTAELGQPRWWFNEHLTPLLLNYADLELKEGERIVVQNQNWLAVVPWWAVWPFETLILPRRHVLRLPDLTDTERGNLANVFLCDLSPIA